LRGTLIQRDGSLIIEGFLAAAYIPHQPNRPGMEILLSLKQDRAFGPCVVLGIGGTLTEWYGQVGNSTVIFPAKGLDQDTVRACLLAHPSLKILCTRSRLYETPPFALDDLVTAVLGLADLGCHCGPDGTSTWTVEELEINPAVATDVRLMALDGVGLVSRRKWPRVKRPAAGIAALLKPRSAVVMGVSAKGPNPGRIILTNLRKSVGIDPKRLFVVHQR
jgi:hypothetical protein